MRTLLICHDDAPLHRDGVARWLGSFSELAGIVVIREGRGATWKRVRRERRRSGALGLADVIAYRVFHRVAYGGADARWRTAALERLRASYAAVPHALPVHVTSRPNDSATEAFVRGAQPDLVLALCKTMLARRIFSIPARGTFVLHPGICPEYRNAHGCFWALARGDRARVGMTLLRIDEGVDTGPVFGWFGCAFDDRRDSHVVIQHQAVLDNLAPLRERLLAIVRGDAQPLDTAGRASAAWGQPRLSAYIGWKIRNHGEPRAGRRAALS